MARALINVPAKAKKGEIVEIKTMMQHPMETGFRPGPDGRLYPRDIIKRFVCTYDGETVFSADLFPAISANPYLSFTMVATVSGVVTFSWTDDAGQTQVQTARIEVE
ncbi:MAG: thiosulfate oxidation carrier complex protein SoxZ [Beijerinckiaceae bacterium]|jgi:sulfur-oxidizing protein SoxZ